MPLVVPAIHETTAYYEVGGRTEKEIVDELNAKGPGEAGEARYWGMAAWTVGWNPRSRDLGRGRCEVHAADLHLDLTITLPRWTQAANATPVVVAKWDRMKAALIAHEHEHARHARDTITALASRLSPQTHAGSCASIEAAVERDAKALVQRGRDLDQELDRRTGHGSPEASRSSGDRPSRCRCFATRRPPSISYFSLFPMA